MPKIDSKNVLIIVLVVTVVSLLVILSKAGRSQYASLNNGNEQENIVDQNIGNNIPTPSPTIKTKNSESYDEAVETVKNSIYKLNSLSSFEYVYKGCDGEESCFEGNDQIDLKNNQYKYYKKIDDTYSEEPKISDYIINDLDLYSGFYSYQKDEKGKYTSKDDNGVKFSGHSIWRWIDNVDYVLKDKTNSNKLSEFPTYTQESIKKYTKKYEKTKLSNGIEYKLQVKTESSSINRDREGKIIFQSDKPFILNEELIARIDENNMIYYLKFPYLYDSVEYTITDTNKEYKFLSHN